MRATLSLDFDVEVDTNEAKETVLRLEGTVLEGTGRDFLQAANNLRATMLARLQNLKRRSPMG